MRERKPGLIRQHPLATIFIGTLVASGAGYLGGAFGGSPAHNTPPVESSKGSTPITTHGEVKAGPLKCDRLTIASSGGNLVLSAVTEGPRVDTPALHYNVDYERGNDITDKTVAGLGVQIPDHAIFDLTGYVTYSLGGQQFQAPCPERRAPTAQ